MKALKEELQNLLAFSTSIFKAWLRFTAGQQDTDGTMQEGPTWFKKPDSAVI